MIHERKFELYDATAKDTLLRAHALGWHPIPRQPLSSMLHAANICIAAHTAEGLADASPEVKDIIRILGDMDFFPSSIRTTPSVEVHLRVPTANLAHVMERLGDVHWPSPPSIDAAYSLSNFWTTICLTWEN